MTVRSHILWRNVTLRSHNIVSERDTPIQLSHYFISSSLLYSRRHFKREGSTLEIQQSHNFRPTTNHTIKTYNHTIKYIGDFTISLNTYQSLFRVYLSNRNKPNLPPQKNRSHASYFYNTFPFLNASEPFQSIKYICIFVS